VLDFERTGPLIRALTDAGISIIDIEGLASEKMLSPGQYTIIIPSGIEFNINAEEVYVTLEQHDASKISKVDVRTRRLSPGESTALARKLYIELDLPVGPFDRWLDRLTNSFEPSAYSSGTIKNYPAIGLRFLKSFYPPAPTVGSLVIEWDERATIRRGNSVETNTLKGAGFDFLEITRERRQSDKNGATNGIREVSHK